MILFTKHALAKFGILKLHKFLVTKSQVVSALENPDFIDHSRLPLLIAQKTIDKSHVLRVVYKKEKMDIKVITFYPGRIKQYYEKS